jgi:hypothetical protein
LARAEQGTLTHIDEDGTPHRRVSYTAIARFIREARQSLDLLAKLSAATPPPETSKGLPNGELSARIRAQLDKIMARSQSRELDAAAVVELSAEAAAPNTRVSDTNPALSERLAVAMSRVAERPSISITDAEVLDD